MSLASRASQYPDAAEALAVVLYPRFQRSDVSIRSIELAISVSGGCRLDLDADRHNRKSEPLKPLCSGNDHRVDGCQYGVQPHRRQHDWRLGLCEAGLSFVRRSRRPISIAPRLRSYDRDMY